MTFIVAHATDTALPLELVETILESLRFDSRTLRAASLVSKEWVPICRAHLFRRIVLHWCDDGSRRSNLLYSLLTHKPTIAKYIHELSVHEGLVSSRPPQITFCFAQNPFLPKILSLLPQLNLLEFRASTLTPWSELNLELSHAFVNAISTSSGLVQVTLASWNFASQPQALIALLTAAAKNAAALVLTDIVTPEVPGHGDQRNTTPSAYFLRPPPGEPTPHSMLRHLAIKSGAISPLPFCTGWFQAQPVAIRSLQLSCSTNHAHISEFLSALGESLEHLELDLRTVYNNGPVDLRQNTRLQSLHLLVSENPLMSLRSNPSVSWVVDILSTVQSFEYLEILRIGCGIDADRPRRLSRSDGNHWCHLDQILRPEKYRRLCSVQIEIKFECHDDLEYIKEARECMPNLCGAGVLDIYTETRRFCCLDY